MTGIPDRLEQGVGPSAGEIRRVPVSRSFRDPDGRTGGTSGNIVRLLPPPVRGEDLLRAGPTVLAQEVHEAAQQLPRDPPRAAANGTRLRPSSDPAGPWPPGAR